MSFNTAEEIDTPDEGAEGGHLGARHRQVAALLTQLATAARSFLLYDAGNDAVKRSLIALIEGFAEALRGEQTIHLDVRPFEIELDGVRVYLNRDRERSLSFRLYRDGVRTLVFRDGFGGEELARLLEILSVRYTGIHQHEDDTVTLLWKAGFKFLDVVAVEGLALKAGDADRPERRRPSEASPFLPPDADLPLSLPERGSTPAWVDIAEGTRELLCEQASAGALPDDCLRLLTLLARGLADPADGMRFSEIVHLCEEFRDFLLSAENLVPLLEYVHLLRRIATSSPAWDPDRSSSVVSLLASCGSDRALRKLIHSVPANQRVMRSQLVELLDLVCPDPFTAVAEALAIEENPAGRAVGRQLLEHYGKRRGPLLRQRFAEAKGRVAADLLRSLARLDGEAPAVFLARQCAHPDPEVREEALWHLERIAYTSALGQAFVDAFRRTDGAHRLRVLAMIERSRDRRFVEPLAAFLETGLLEPSEAVEVAGVLGRLEGPAGLARWKGWLTPTGRFLRRRLPGSVLQQAAAAAAVAQVPGDDATQLLEQACAAASSEARSWIGPLLATRPGLGERPFA